MSQSDGSCRPGSSVPPEPVVRIVVDPLTGEVTVNGVAVDHDGSVSLHQVAVHAAARQVAQVLRRPVRAVAYVAGARSRMVIHPDGRATDVEVDVAAFPPVSDPAAAAPRPARPRRSRGRRPSRRAAALLTVAALVLGGWGAVLVGLAARSDRIPSAEATPAASTPRGSLPSPSAVPTALPSFRVAEAQELRPTRRLRVTATTPSATSLSLDVRATHLPATVRIVVRGPATAEAGTDVAEAGSTTVREIELRTAGRRMVLRGLAPGEYTWTASALDARRVRGRVVLAPTPVPVAPAPTYSPSPQPAPTPSSPPKPPPNLPPGPVDPDDPGPTGPVG